VWSKSSVRAILQNPTYTGRGVWNKQRKHEVLKDENDVAAGHRMRQRWNPREDWVYSEQITHPALIDQETFDRAQQMRGEKNHRGAPRHRTVGRPYLLRGILLCGICERRMQGQVSNGKPHYRCRITSEYATGGTNLPANVYLREDEVVPLLDRWLAQVFDPERIESTAALMAAVDEPEQEVVARTAAAQQVLTECNKQMISYQRLVDAGADPTDVVGWMNETRAKRLAAERELVTLASHTALTPAAIKEMLAAVPDKVAMLASADPTTKQRVYGDLGLSLSYEPDQRLVRVQARPSWGYVRVGGGTRTPTTQSSLRGEFWAEAA